MRTTQGNMRRSLVNVELFLDQRAAELGGVVGSGIRKQLNDAIVTLSGHISEQSDQTMVALELTRTHRTARTILLQDHMRPIASIARLNATNVPALAALRMPSGEPSNELLAVTADMMGEAAARQKNVFIDAGLPADFIEQLGAAAAALLTTQAARDHSRTRSIGATKGLRAELSRSRKIVSVLDALVRKQLRGNDAALRAWSVAKRVLIVPVAGTPVPVPVPVPAAAPAPAGTKTDAAA